MSRRPLTGRADLLLAMASEDAVVADLARRLGFQRIVALPEPQQPELIEPEEASDPIDSELKLAPRPPVPWWRAQEFRARKVIPTPLPEADDSNRLSNQFEVTLSRFDPLATQPEILTRLRQVTDLTRPGSRIDVDRVVYELSRGRQLTQFPRLNRRSWGQDLHVVIDRARYLVPYWRDQKIVGQAIKRLLPKGGGTICVLHEGAEIPVIQWPDDQRGEELRPRPGATVLALSDLGSMQDANFPAAERRWMRMGKKLQDQECAALAVVPCRPDAVPQRLARLWTLIPWERYSGHSGKPTDAVTVETCERILALLSAAVRIEPRLLRAVRKLLPAGRRDPGLEARVWQKCHGTMHCSAAALSQEQTVEFREALLRDELNQEAWALIEAGHREEYAGVGCLEVLRLGKHAAGLGAEDRMAGSRLWFQRIGTGATEFGADFFYKAATQLTPEAWEAAPELHVLWNRFCPDEAVPPGYDPALAGVDGGPLQTIRVSLVGDRLEYRRRGEVLERSSPLAVVRLTNPEIMVDSFDDWPADDAAADSFWKDGTPPEWADRWGRDSIGPWVEFVIGEARQRMRWIPPGAFLMGSAEKPKSEGYPETPRHLVTLSRGYWVFDTPCTQLLWEAVMDENPSHFKGPLRPVERVSWDACQEYLSRINERCVGLELSLPTEAEWEYACRAGTETARYAGDGPLQEIAWYRKNSDDTTHDVGKLRANRWGLYDMLGNVWEWCRDHTGREYSSDPLVDPFSDRGDSAADRVLRGGSWAFSARSVRAAYRGGDPPGDRGSNGLE